MIYKAYIWVAALLASLFLNGCSDKSTKRAEVSVPKIKPTELTLPNVPETLTSVQERGSFLAFHFWDALDSLAPALKADTALIEQTFANFLGILPYVAEDVQGRSVDILIEKIATDTAAVGLIEYLARKYLDDPNSPMRSEDLYLCFLRNFSSNPQLPEDLRFRSEFHLEQSMKNRPGDRAADFSLVTREGTTGTLYGQIAADTTIVMFYDPDCSHCREITQLLKDQRMPYRILAVDVAGNRQKWEQTMQSLPEAWHVAYALTPVEDEDLYFFPALPSFYLLAPEGKVILKDFAIRL